MLEELIRDVFGSVVELVQAAEREAEHGRAKELEAAKEAADARDRLRMQADIIDQARARVKNGEMVGIYTPDSGHSYFRDLLIVSRRPGATS